MHDILAPICELHAFQSRSNAVQPPSKSTGPLAAVSTVLPCATGSMEDASARLLTIWRRPSEAEVAACQMTNGDLDVLTLTSADRAAYLRARQLLDPLGIGIEAGAAHLADAVKKLGGVSLAETADTDTQSFAVPIRTGTDVRFVVPSPSSPKPLLPHAHKLPSDFRANEKAFPLATLTQSLSLPRRTKRGRS